MDIRTHTRIDRALVGEPLALVEGEATCALETTEAMRADDEGLVHGGFVFGLADYAAMLAVNERTVVLARADVRFSAPVPVGARVVAHARVVSRENKKRTVEVTAECAGQQVFAGTFYGAVPDRHVLMRRAP